MGRGGVPLPAGYTKLEYLESDGTQYIDTGFKPNQDTRVVMDYQALGSADSAIASVVGTTYFYTLFVDNALIGTRYGTQTAQNFGDNAPAWGDRLEYDKNKNVTTVDGYTITHTAETFQLIYSLTLFARNNKGTVDWCSKARLYSCRIYDNGTLIRDYIPCVNASDVSGLYDLVDDVFYPLLQVVTTKKKNKLTVDTGLIDNGDGTFTPWGVLSATYLVTSTLTVNVKGSNGSLAINNTLYLPNGNFSVSTKNWLGLNASIISISPTEDDTYIYTF